MEEAPDGSPATTGATPDGAEKSVKSSSNTVGKQPNIHSQPTQNSPKPLIKEKTKISNS